MLITNNDEDWVIGVTTLDGTINISQHKHWNKLYRRRINDSFEYTDLARYHVYDVLHDRLVESLAAKLVLDEEFPIVFPYNIPPEMFIIYIGGCTLDRTLHVYSKISGVYCIEKGNDKKYIDRFFKENPEKHDILEISKFEYMSYLIEGGIDVEQI